VEVEIDTTVYRPRSKRLRGRHYRSAPPSGAAQKIKQKILTKNYYPNEKLP